MGPILDSPENEFIGKLAGQYNVAVRFEPLGEGVRGYKIDGEIVLNMMNPPERRNWTFCHELAHIVLGHSKTPADGEEREADIFAAEIMLPERDFIPDSSGIELDKLKELYPHASYEVLSRRCLQFGSGVISIFDCGQLTSRMGSDGINFPPSPTPLELHVFRECWENKRYCELNSGGLNIRGYYIDQGRSVVRVYLVTQVVTDID